MNNQTAERDEVRRILGERLTESELDDAIAAQRREDAWRARPWPIGPANHAHRYSTCHGPCEQGRKPCPTAEACECSEDEPKRSGDLVRIWALILAAWAAIAATLIVTGVTL